MVYFTGLGEVDNAVATGTAALADPLSRPTTGAVVMVGEARGTVLFLGLAPGFVGLGQANIELPLLEPGTYTLSIQIGEAVSNFPVITIGG